MASSSMTCMDDPASAFTSRTALRTGTHSDKTFRCQVTAQQCHEQPCTLSSLSPSIRCEKVPIAGQESQTCRVHAERHCRHALHIFILDIVVIGFARKELGAQGRAGRSKERSRNRVDMPYEGVLSCESMQSYQ